MPAVADIPLRRIEEAARRLRGLLEPTPVVPFPSWSERGEPGPIQLKLETLQPVGSFKVRGALNAVASLSDAQRRAGVYTASAGNMAQALAYAAARVGSACAVVVPETAPAAKLDAAARLGAELVEVPFDEWWDVIVCGRYGPLRDRTWIHPFADPDVIAGNGTIGLELVEQAPDMATVYVPVGGGGLISGIGVALRERAAHVEVRGSEVETAAALAAALRAGEPTVVPYQRTFIDGMGSRRITDAMWPLLETVVHGSAVVEVAAVADAVRLLLADCHLVAEGAGAASLACALAEPGRRPAVCVVSGAGIDLPVLTDIARGPEAVAPAT
jgi:threonine dehydratase